MNEENAVLDPLVQMAVQNNMGVKATAVCFHGITSTKMEKAVLRFLDAKGADTRNLMVRVIPKNMCKNQTLSKWADKTSFPFVVILFNQLNKENYTKKGGLEQDAFNDIRSALFNFSDNAQIELKQDQQLNEIIKKLVYRDLYTGSFRWDVNKKAKKAYIALVPELVFMICFDMPLADANKYIIDFIDTPITRTDRNTYMTETIMNIAITNRPPKKRPSHDPISDIK